MKSVETNRPLAVSLAVAAILVFAAACGGSGDGGRGAAKEEAPSLAAPLAKSALLDGPQAAEGPATAQKGDQASPVSTQTGGQVGDHAPEFQNIASWINSGPLAMQQLRGKVVLIDFWTYTCVNCIRTFPYLKDWHAKYAGKGLVIVGVHSPEFEFEEITENVVRSSRDFGLEYPIAQDNDFATWRAYGNQFWPAKYLVDKDGVVRYSHFGEGAYDGTEAQIRSLLEEAGAGLSGVVAFVATQRPRASTLPTSITTTRRSSPCPTPTPGTT